MSKRVLVCGGRSYNDSAHVFFMLDQIHAAVGFSHVTTGGAAGADSLAETWAFRKNIPFKVFPANWKRDGKAAGPIRNLRMLAESKPDLVVAFPGGKGTAHMKKIARAHGVQLVDVPALR